MAKITVYATKQSAFNIVHPTDGALKSGGSSWENDGFTARMLSDGALTTIANAAVESDLPAYDPTKPPAHYTGAGDN
jgi:hypothetical protein